MSKVDESPKIRPYEPGDTATQAHRPASPEQVTKHEAASRAQQGLEAMGFEQRDDDATGTETPLDSALATAKVFLEALTSEIGSLENKLKPVCRLDEITKPIRDIKPDEPHSVVVSFLSKHVDNIHLLTERVLELYARLEV